MQPAPAVDLVEEHQGDPLEQGLVHVNEDHYIEPDLSLAAYIRDLGGTRLEPSEAGIRLMYQRADEWHSSPTTRERMVEINELTQTFFESRFTDSWGRDYRIGRFGIDLAGDERFRPGQAPAGWATLVHHLRGHGISDTPTCSPPASPWK